MSWFVPSNYLFILFPLTIPVFIVTPTWSRLDSSWHQTQTLEILWDELVYNHLISHLLWVQNRDF